MEQQRRATFRQFVRAGAAFTAFALLASGCAITRSGRAHDATDGGAGFDGGTHTPPDLGANDLDALELGVDLAAPDLGTDLGPEPIDLGPPDLGVDLGVDFGVDLGPPPPPCGGRCTGMETCVGSTCLPCGGSAEACCDMNRCHMGLVCAIGLTCAPCGGTAQLCCADGRCAPDHNCWVGVCD